MKKLALLLLILTPALYAQEDPFADAFFPPELIMQNQQILGLTAEQHRRGRAKRALPCER